MDNPLAALRLLVLLVLAGPLLAAVAVCLLGRVGPRAVRRAAAGFALFHLCVTAIVAFFAADMIRDRAHLWSDFFRPVLVPGDAGLGASPMGSQHDTTWSLLEIGAPTSALPPADIQFFIGLDGLNVGLVLLTSLMTLIAVWLSWDAVTERVAAYFAWLFVLETGVIGAFLSFDAILFYAFFELTLIPAFFLIGRWGGGSGRRDAARTFFLYTLLGSLLTLVGLIGVVLTNPTPYSVIRENGKVMIAYEGFKPDAAGREWEAKPGPYTFSIPRLMRNVQSWTVTHERHVARAKFRLRVEERRLAGARDSANAATNDPALQRAVSEAAAAVESAGQALRAAEAARDRRMGIEALFFFLLMAGFAVKTPIFPFHTWLPAAYAEAPIAVTMYLSALLAKLGTFGMLRVVVPLTPDAAFQYGLPVFGFLGAVGIVYGALCAYAQRDAKLLVAYSSVSHLGLLVLGLFALNREGMTGAVLHMINHGLTVGAMFGLLGFLSIRYRTLDMNQYGGLIARYPGYAVLFFVVALAGIGLPGLNNFVSEMMLIAGLFDPVHTEGIGYGMPAAAAFGVFLSAWYVITMLRRLFFGPLHEPPTADGEPKGLTARESLAFGIPAVLCIVLGVLPQPALTVIRDGVEPIVSCVSAARERATGKPLDEPNKVDLAMNR